MNRRKTLAGLAAGAVAAVTAPAVAWGAQATPGSDAALIALCDRFTELERQMRAYYPDGATPIEDDGARDRVQAPLHAEQEEILDRVTEMEATTLDGIRARLRMTMAYDPACLTGAGWDDQMLSSLLDDMQRVLA